MDSVGIYCCFNCPKKDFEERHLKDKCATCGHTYDFPLLDYPSQVGEYTITGPLGRGFYGATFVAERRGIIHRKNVLKIVPKKVYQHFEKNFEKECQTHSDAAESAAYLVGIDSVFDETIKFGNAEIECHVAVLEYLDGHSLQDYLSGEKTLSATGTAQIAADLFRIREELANRRINHNDFHAGNIVVKELTKEQYRQSAMDPSIRAVAIDFGSLSEDRRDGGKYKSDLHWIAEHIQTLSFLLTNKDDELSDLDSRLALALKMIAQSITPATENQRTPKSDDLVRKIEDEYFRVVEPWHPWRSQFSLRKFDESYNAQTLEAWNVPQLLVDSDDKWQKMISAPGPLIVTGMRGCGKTMLLRALQFHARAVQRGDELDLDILKRVRNDGYVGFFVSASSLLTLADSQPLNVSNLFARLAIAYALEAARSLAHLSNLDASAVSERAAQHIQNALASILRNNTSDKDTVGIQQLEHHLVDLLIQAYSSDSQIQINLHPSNAFQLLADSIRQCTNVWEGSQVLFLLDDVSTRYLTTDLIDEILSALIFQKTNCAFKITSETGTIFLSLKSPGGVEPAAHSRDFKTFDLGVEVHVRLKRQGGKQFVEDILKQRAKIYSPHPQVSPTNLLGDQSLVNIARTITSTGPNSVDRKKVYHGMSALKAVCVGDIGSVITIYENILNKVNGNFPVSSQIQSEIFQDFCSWHLYLLDRRGSELKSAAKSFAAASHQLLMQSARKKDPCRLRQYSSIYVRVTAGDRDEQGKRLQRLVDAGVFVFQGGAPRTKTKDSDPIHQFKLTFRKIYGLADFIGLAERDRFELSGAELEEWLKKPDTGAEILMRNLGTHGDPDDEYFEETESLAAENSLASGASKMNDMQRELSLSEMPTSASLSAPSNQNVNAIKLPTIDVVGAASDELKHVDVLFIGLGFEKRAQISAIRSIDILSPKSVVAVRYTVKGRSKKILEAVSSRNIPCTIIDYEDLQSGKYSIPSSSIAIDISGLTKAAIFRTITDTLKQNSSAVVAHTEADKYYPLEESLARVLEAHAKKDYHAFLLELKEILSGEEGPYTPETMHSLKSDGTRMKVLLAFGSAKHERLIQLIEDRDYDCIKVVIDNSKSTRATVAKFAAEVAVRGAEAGSIEECNIKDPNEILQIIEREFHSCYIDGGLNFELGLTGDKVESIAVATFCAVVNVNRVWYVKPKAFDSKRYTKGVKNTTFYKITV